MSAYKSVISDVHKSHRVEKLVLHHLIFLLIKISKCLLVPIAILFHILLPYKKSLIFAVEHDEIAFGTNQRLLILKSKNIR